MPLKKILEEQRKLVELDSITRKYLQDETKKVVEVLRKEIFKQKIEAEIFIGGSFAKGTLEKKEIYDIDIFSRFNWKLDNLSDILEKVVREVNNELNFIVKKIHGSRDYFRLENKNVVFEIVPVYKIRHPREARNVTDLSYFHVNYVKKKIKGNNLAMEIMLAKKFFQSQKVYGAETFISGFSGYGIECLIINYGSFDKMLIELNKVESGERLILDTEHLYKKKQDVLFEMNESKLQSPIILVDPTWKERNVLAALSYDVFRKLQEASRKFLKNPSKKFFEIKKLDLNSLKKLKGEFLHVRIETDRQEGDIAGSKMKKFSMFLIKELSKYFNILGKEFVYFNGKEADFYFVVKPKDKILIYGPPVAMRNNVNEFKKRHKNFFEKDEKLYSEMKVDFSGKEFLEDWQKDNKIKMNEMGIVGLNID